MLLVVICLNLGRGDYSLSIGQVARLTAGIHTGIFQPHPHLRVWLADRRVGALRVLTDGLGC